MNPPGIIIIGGGLAGLSAGILLSRNGFPVKLFEKKAYPFHRVCGEYVSNEVLPFFKNLGLKPESWGTSSIENLEISSVQGRVLKQKLDLGGFGISRYLLDEILMNTLKESGAQIITENKINQVNFSEDQFDLTDSMGETHYADLVIGAFGKRSNLDQVLERPFFKKRSPYLGVKYHLNWSMDNNLIQLHNFTGGYAGISAIENNRFCFCYLTKTANLKKHHSLQEMEDAQLKKNPFLKNILNNAEFLWDKPQVIHEISFEPKELVNNHILMCGDSAGLISPLCGNGMAIALHSGKILAESILVWSRTSARERVQLEEIYKRNWNQLFKTRLWFGRQIQKVFGDDVLTDFSLRILSQFPRLTKTIISSTHGEAF